MGVIAVKKQIIKSVLAVVIAIFLFFFASTLYFLYELEWKKTVITELENTQTGHSVTLQEIGSPFLFGPSRVQIILRNEKGKRVDQAEDYIYNDGKSLDEGNISVIWTDTSANATLYGEEQGDRLLVLQYQR